jgi:tRNA (cmo5U34)-methyltransferase
MNETDISLNETVWDRHARVYDEPRRRLVPDFDRFYGTAVDLAADALDGVAAPEVLDLGAGTGLLAAAVLRALPGARLTLFDGSAPMLERAHERLGDEVALVHGDFLAPLPNVAGGYHAVVSSLAIHHLDHDGKRALYGAVLDVLRPGGIFVNAEQVLAPTSRQDEQYRRHHEDDARRLGSDDAEWAASMERMREDRCATTEDQVAWLRALGYVDVDVAFKRWRFAVFSGRRPGHGGADFI